MPTAITIGAIQRVHVGLLSAAAVSAALTAIVSPWGILLGGGLMAANVWLMQQLLHYVLHPGRNGRVGRVIVLGLAKQLLMLAMVSVLFWRVEIDAGAFAVGVSMLLVASVAVALRAERGVA